MENVPKTFKGLFEFYHREVKFYYSYAQSENVLPLEMLFELNAALDHISRAYVYEEETEEEACKKAYGHLKRACLDTFKIAFRETIKKYDELRKLDISLIDNGEYERNIKKLISDIKKEGTEARRLEGNPKLTDLDNTVPPFNKWTSVFEKCLYFEHEFYQNKNVEWAKKKGWWINLKLWFALLGLSVFIGIPLKWLLEKLWKLFTG